MANCLEHQTPELNDVLCGRGNGVSLFPGNVKFRNLVMSHKAEYRSLEKSKKIPLAEAIVKKIQSLDPPGRFLKKGEDGCWKVISKEKALLKTSQALREGMSTTYPHHHHARHAVVLTEKNEQKHDKQFQQKHNSSRDKIQKDMMQKTILESNVDTTQASNSPTSRDGKQQSAVASSDNNNDADDSCFAHNDLKTSSPPVRNVDSNSSDFLSVSAASPSVLRVIRHYHQNREASSSSSPNMAFISTSLHHQEPITLKNKFRKPSAAVISEKIHHNNSSSLTILAEAELLLQKCRRSMMIQNLTTEKENLIPKTNSSFSIVTPSTPAPPHQTKSFINTTNKSKQCISPFQNDDLRRDESDHSCVSEDFSSSSRCLGMVQDACYHLGGGSFLHDCLGEALPSSTNISTSMRTFFISELLRKKYNNNNEKESHHHFDDDEEESDTDCHYQHDNDNSQRKAHQE